ncbi:MAG: hypothetical protein AMXMBFR13_24960 [Phycisphaerae bacterium]
MRRYLRLMMLFFRVSLQDAVAYRIDLVTNLLLAVGALVAELMALWTIFSNTQSLAGWNAWEILALLGVFRIMSGMIALMIAPNMRLIMEDIREGKLDYVLLKPVNSQFYASIRRVVVWRLVDIGIGIGMAAAAGVALSTSVSIERAVLFILMLSAGTTIIYSCWLVLATMAFWFTRISNIEMVFWNVFEAGRYPVDIYRPAVRWGLTYIVPLAFLTTYPAGALIGRVEPGNVGAAFLLAGLALTGATLFWRYGIRHYSGASA